MFEGRVVAIKVRPYPDGLVYMDRIPYKRNFGESEPMREDEKARMISMKISSGKADSGKLGTIEKAIVEKKCVCLKRYSSASGIRDRHVEAFKVTGEASSYGATISWTGNVSSTAYPGQQTSFC